MNTRNTIRTSLLLSICAFGILLYTACKKNDCGSTSCKNGGVCVHDSCECPTGYIGNDCGTTWSTQYFGTYNCIQACNSSPSSTTWTSIVTGNPTNGQDTILISNFGNYGHSLTAGVDNNGNVYVIPTGFSGINGTGKLTGSVLKINYTIASSGYSCTLTMTKQ